MEINNDALLNQVNRLQQKRNSQNQKLASSQTDTGSVTQKNTGSDELKLTQSIANYLNKSGKETDDTLRQLQGDISSKQQMSQTIKNLLSQSFDSGKQVMVAIQKDAPGLAQQLQMDNQDVLLNGAGNEQWQQILENANIKIELSIKDIYGQMEKLMQKRNIEFENIAALGLPQTGETNKINSMIQNLQANTDGIATGMRSQNVENLLS